MKFINYTFILLIVINFMACSDDSDDSSPDLSNLSYKLSEVQFRTGSAFLTYNSNGKLIKISDQSNTEKMDIDYQSDALNLKYNSEPSFNLLDPVLYETTNYHPYEITYSNGNPVLINAIVKNSLNEWEEYRLEISYDDKNNPLYLVLDQSDMLPTLDDLILSSPDPIYENLKANGLLSVNNVRSIVYKDSQGTVLGTISIDYEYNDSSLPTTAIISSPDATESISFKYTSI